jgi:DNA polymerase-3 subunit delta
MLYVLWGEDEYSREQALLEIKKGLGDLSLLATNTNLLEGQKLSLNELQAVAGAMPFLAPKRLVIIKGLLERFDPKDKTGKPKKSSGSGAKADESQLLADCLRGIPESTVLILTDAIEVKKPFLQNNPLFNAIADKAEVRQFPKMAKGTKLSQWVQARVTQLGGSISTQATNLIMDIIGGDLLTMNNEIAKLVAYTGGSKIEEKDIRMVVSASQEADIFAMIDSIMDHKAGVAEQILNKLLQNGQAPQQILALLARQVQTLVLLKDLRNQKKSSSDIQTRTGLFNSFVWDKMSRRADKYTLERLKEIYQSLLQTDLAIKTGRYEGDLAVNILVAELSESKKP